MASQLLCGFVVAVWASAGAAGLLEGLPETLLILSITITSTTIALPPLLRARLRVRPPQALEGLRPPTLFNAATIRQPAALPILLSAMTRLRLHLSSGNFIGGDQPVEQ